MIHCLARCHCLRAFGSLYRRANKDGVVNLLAMGCSFIEERLEGSVEYLYQKQATSS